MNTTPQMIKRAAQAELRRLGFVRLDASNSGSSYYERINIDLSKPIFGTTDHVRLADHHHPTVFNGCEYDVSGFESLEDVIASIREDFDL